MLKTHCRKGHPFSFNNTYVAPKTGIRACRTCRDAKHGCVPDLSKPYIQGRQKNSGEWKDGKPSVEYKTWCHIKERCYNANDKSYHNYGGRGIKVCERWLHFANFLEDMGRRPTDDKYSIDRIDSNGDYEPNNCRWATQKEQQNNKRNNVFHTEDGLTMTVAQWAEHLGMLHTTVYLRIRDWGSVRKANKVTWKDKP